MKKSSPIMFVVMLCACGSVIADEPTQNGEFNVPEIGSITIDGNLDDWSYSTPWSEPFIIWNVRGEPMTSTTKAKFAWNDADDLLYVAIQTDQANGGHPAVGVGITIDDIPAYGVGATQLAFDAGSGTYVSIMNEIQYYADKYPSLVGWGGGKEGVVAAQTNNGSVWTYEIAIPYWQNWKNMDVKQPISIDDVYYNYIIMENVLEGGNGTDMTYLGNPDFARGAFDVCAALTFRAAPLPGDANIDGKVDDSDAAVLAANWLANSAEWGMGDFNGDNVVNAVDATLLAANWQPDVVIQPASVPEPSTMILCGIGCLMLLIRKITRQ